jgi:4-hydroxybenzoate polyprenyltransferase
MLIDHLRLARPEQWVKNVFLFAGLIFSREFRSPASILQSLFAFAVFCVLSSAGYILNDIIDSKEDLLIGSKAKRPLAAKKVMPGTAIALAIILIAAGLAGAFLVNRFFLHFAAMYVLLSVSYSMFLKHIVILDVLVISVGYVLRAVAGAAAISVEISAWLILCTFLVALFIILSRRRAEIMLLGDAAVQHRKVLFQYSVVLLDKMIAVSASACLVSYCIYTLAPGTVDKFHTTNMIYTIPFVVYGLFRYLYIADRKTGADAPSRALVTDIPLISSLFLWGLACVLILSL